MARDTGESKFERIRRRLMQGCLITAVVLIGTNVLLVLAVPFLGVVEFQAVKNLISPPPPTPYATSPLQTQMTLWQGNLYAYGPNGNTSVFDPNTGALRSTLSGLVIGSDDDLLYASQGILNSSPRPDYPMMSPTTGFPLIARDASGAQVWSYSDATEPGAIKQLQSGGNLVYILETPHTSTYPAALEIVALNKSDGSQRWSYTWTPSIADYTPQPSERFVIAQQTLYFHTPRQVIALSASDGRVEWQRTIDTFQMMLDGQLLYLPDGEGLAVLSARSGADVWRANYQGASGGAGFLLDRHVVYLNDADGRITARRGDTGQRLWQTAALTTPNRYLLSARDGLIFTMSDQPEQISALSEESGHVTWTTTWNYYVPWTSVAVIGSEQGVAYISKAIMCGGAMRYCTEYSAFNEQSGKLLWQRQIPEWGIASTRSGQMFYSVSLLHRRQVRIDSGIAGAHHATVTNCSDIASLYALSLTSGTFTWQRATPFRCENDAGY